MEKTKVPPAEMTRIKAWDDEIQAAIFMSSRGNETSVEEARDGMQQSVFSFHLINGLKGEADFNQDRQISSYEIFLYVRDNVLRDTEYEQHPVMYGKFDPNAPFLQVK